MQQDYRSEVLGSNDRWRHEYQNLWLTETVTILPILAGHSVVLYIPTHSIPFASARMPLLGCMMGNFENATSIL